MWALAQLVASDIHPLVTARVIDYLDGELVTPPDYQQRWLRHWIVQGLNTLEALVAQHPETGRCCHKDEPTPADICVVPQIYTAQRSACDPSNLQTLLRIHAHCSRLRAFREAAPENQPDARAVGWGHATRVSALMGRSLRRARSALPPTLVAPQVDSRPSTLVLLWEHVSL